jgi:excisionase family DNA binding protein
MSLSRIDAPGTLQPPITQRHVEAEVAHCVGGVVNALLHTVEETAEILKISRWKVFELIRTHQLRSVKIGGSRRIPIRAIEEYVERLMGGAA